MKNKVVKKISMLLIFLFSLSLNGGLLSKSLVSADETPQKVIAQSVTIDKHTVWEEMTVEGDVTVLSGTTLTINGIVNITGTLKVEGVLFSYGNLTAETIEATNYFRGHTKTLTEGTIYARGGKITVGTLKVTNFNTTLLPGPAIESIEITSFPDKSAYMVGEEVSLEGLIVVGHYSDDSTEIVTERADLRDYDKDTPGEREIFVLVENQVASFKVTYEEGPVLTGIKVVTPPDKTEYQIEEALDLTGLVVHGVYSDGSEEVLAVTAKHISGFNSSAAAENQRITISIDGFVATFSVDVLPEEAYLTGIELVSPPAKTVYYIGEELDLDGLVVKGMYSDEAEEVLPVMLDHISGFDSSIEVENQIITVSINGFHTAFIVKIMNEPLTVTAGLNRYDTAVKVSMSAFEKADTAILVSGLDYPDALAAGPLAFAMGGPVLLTRSGSLNSTTRNELQRLGTTQVIILGGLSAISQAVEDELNDLGYVVERISGATRNSTAAATALKMKEMKPSVDEVVLVSGENYADSIAVGSAAAKFGLPILLTKSTVLSSATKDAIEELAVFKVTLIGGTSAISAEIETELQGMGLEVVRLAGLNRALTSVEVAKRFYSEAVEAVFVNGWDYPDALSAAPLGALHNAPIILVNKAAVSSGVQSYLSDSKITTGIVVGGDAAVGAETRDLITDILKEK